MNPELEQMISEDIQERMHKSMLSVDGAIEFGRNEKTGVELLGVGEVGKIKHYLALKGKRYIILTDNFQVAAQHTCSDGNARCEPFVLHYGDRARTRQVFNHKGALVGKRTKNREELQKNLSKARMLAPRLGDEANDARVEAYYRNRYDVVSERIRERVAKRAAVEREREVWAKESGFGAW